MTDSLRLDRNPPVRGRRPGGDSDPALNDIERTLWMVKHAAMSRGTFTATGTPTATVEAAFRQVNTNCCLQTKSCEVLVRTETGAARRNDVPCTL